MEDEKIVDLYWERSETAIKETEKKYGKYCHSIAYRILFSKEDAEECVNDTYVKAWYAMPPHRPNRLSTFLGKITRHLALDRYEKQNAKKRQGTELVFDEIAECLPAEEPSDFLADEIAVRDAVNAFLASLKDRDRIVFMQRYWYFCSVKEIAKNLELTESNVKMILHRTRGEFKTHLEKEGLF